MKPFAFSFVFCVSYTVCRGKGGGASSVRVPAWFLRKFIFRFFVFLSFFFLLIFLIVVSCFCCFIVVVDASLLLFLCFKMLSRVFFVTVFVVAVGPGSG